MYIWYRNLGAPLGLTGEKNVWIHHPSGSTKPYVLAIKHTSWPPMAHETSLMISISRYPIVANMLEGAIIVSALLCICAEKYQEALWLKEYATSITTSMHCAHV